MCVQCDFCTLHSANEHIIARAYHVAVRLQFARLQQPNRGFSCDASSAARSIEMTSSSVEKRGWNVLFYNLKNMLNYVLIYLQMACVLCFESSASYFHFWNYYDIVRDVIKFYYFVCLVNNPAAGQFYKHISFEMCLSFGLLFFTRKPTYFAPKHK